MTFAHAPEMIDLLATRRSVNPNFLAGPGPSRAQIETLLSLASRVPDHGKLAPWRFLVIEGGARERLGAEALAIRLGEKPDLDDSARQAELKRFAHAPLVIAIVSRARPHVKIPVWEQQLSAGAVCMALSVAAKVLGFSSAWLTDWPAYSAPFRAALGLAEDERIAGFIHIGKATTVPDDRPRPALVDIVTWME